jgi:hypothetical protein
VRTISGRYRPTRQALENASLAALFYALVVIAVALLAEKAMRNVPRAFVAKLDPDPDHRSQARTLVLRFVASVSMIAHAAVGLGLPVGPMAQPLGTIGAPAIALSLLFWDAERSRSSTAHAWFWGALIFEAGLGLRSGMLGSAMLPSLVAIALFWTQRGKMPTALLVAGALLFGVLNPAKHYYRQVVWYDRAVQERSLLERLEVWGDAITYAFDDVEAGEGVQQSLDSLRGRVGTLAEVGQVFDWVPGRVPHAGAERWLATLPMLVPRVFWPDKPVMETYFNRDYTFTFRLQHRRTARSTSLALPSVADGYWRLGWLGVGIEATVFGLMLGFAQAVSRVSSFPALLIAVSLLQFRSQYHAFGLLNGSIQQLFTSCLVVWFVGALTRALEGRSSARPPFDSRRQDVQPLR